MATTSPDNLRTPNPGDPYNLVADLATFANDVQVALNKKVSNLLKGTGAERTAATGTSTNGMLWQDTDGIKMIWRKDGAAWVPAVWRWSGTSSQRTGFTQAPDGFEWFDTSNNSEYFRTGGSWKRMSAPWTRAETLGIGTLAAGWSHLVDPSYNGLMARIQGGTLYMFGALTKSSSILANDIFFNIDAAYRPGAAVVSYTWTAQNGFTLAQPDGKWVMAFAGGTTAYVGASWPIG